MLEAAAISIGDQRWKHERIEQAIGKPRHVFRNMDVLEQHAAGRYPFARARVKPHEFTLGAKAGKMIFQRIEAGRHLAESSIAACGIQFDLDLAAHRPEYR
jgi:hypothetical protein